MILAIDTAGERSSVALSGQDAVEVRELQVGDTRLERVLPLVHELLTSCGARPQSCEAFAFGSGPGPFTGLRVACTIVQGLAFACGRPVVPVGNLEALALASLRGEPASEGSVRVLTAIDARMGQAYWAVFERSAGGLWHAVAAPAACDLAQLPECVDRFAPDVLAGSAFSLPGVSPAGRAGRAPRLAGIDRAGAREILELAIGRLRRGQFVPARDAAPTYVRERVARTVAERAQGPR